MHFQLHNIREHGAVPCPVPSNMTKTIKWYLVSICTLYINYLLNGWFLLKTNYRFGLLTSWRTRNSHQTHKTVEHSLWGSHSKLITFIDKITHFIIIMEIGSICDISIVRTWFTIDLNTRKFNSDKIRVIFHKVTISIQLSIGWYMIKYEEVVSNMNTNVNYEF